MGSVNTEGWIRAANAGAYMRALKPALVAEAMRRGLYPTEKDANAARKSEIVRVLVESDAEMSEAERAAEERRARAEAVALQNAIDALKASRQKESFPFANHARTRGEHRAAQARRKRRNQGRMDVVAPPMRSRKIRRAMERTVATVWGKRAAANGLES